MFAIIHERLRVLQQTMARTKSALCYHRDIVWCEQVEHEDASVIDLLGAISSTAAQRLNLAAQQGSVAGALRCLGATAAEAEPKQLSSAGCIQLTLFSRTSSC